MNFNVSENPQFYTEIRKLETTDQGHADTFNPNYEKLFNNTLYLKKKQESVETQVGNADISEVGSNIKDAILALKVRADEVATDEDIDNMFI